MDKRRYVEKEKKSVLGIVICLVISIAVFIAVLIIQRAITGGEEKKTVVVAIKDISAPGFIDAKDVADYFEEREVSAELAYAGVFESVEDVFGDEKEVYVVNSLAKGEIVSDKCIVGGEKFLQSYKNPVEMGIRVDSFENAAAGTIRRGDVVDMCVLDDLGEEKVIKLYILQAFDSSGLRIEISDTVSVAEAFTVLIERDQYAEVAEIIDLGEFDLIRTENVK